MLLVAYRLLYGQYAPGLLLAQEADPANPLAWLPSLGPFAAAAAIGWVYTRDLRKRLDDCQTKLDERWNADAEIRDTFRIAVRTIEANTVAMASTRDALRQLETRMRALERQRR